MQSLQTHTHTPEHMEEIGILGIRPKMTTSANVFVCGVYSECDSFDVNIVHRQTNLKPHGILARIEMVQWFEAIHLFFEFDINRYFREGIRSCCVQGAVHCTR